MKTLECQICSINISKPLLDKIDKPNKTIINDYKEIEPFCEKNKGKILKLFYFFRNNIQKILYKLDNVIVIDIEKLNIQSQLSELFYLSLLLHKSNLVNFNFSFDFIKSLDSIKEENFIKKIILSKIIIILIDYTKGLDYYYQYQKELAEIKKIILN